MPTSIVRTTAGRYQVIGEFTVTLAAGSDLFNSMTFLPIDSAGNRYAPFSVMEGIAMHACVKEAPFRSAAGVLLVAAFNALKRVQLEVIFAAVESDELYDSSLVFDTLDKCTSFFKEVGAAERHNAALMLDGSCFKVLSGATDPLADAEQGFVSSIPLNGRDDARSLAEVGDFLLMLGPRGNSAVRNNEAGQMRTVSNLLWSEIDYKHSGLSMHGLAQLFWHFYADFGPPVQLRPISQTMDGVLGQFIMRKRYHDASDDTSKLQVICDCFDQKASNWENLYSIASTFPVGTRSFVGIRTLIASISPKTPCTDPVDFLNASDLIMQERSDHTAAVIARGGVSGAELIKTLVGDSEVTAVKSVDAEHDGSSGAGAGSQLAVKNSKLSISKLKMNDVVTDPTFLVMRTKTESKLEKGGTLTESKLHALFRRLLCSEGSLIFNQVLTRHGHIRDSHEFLALVHRLRPSYSAYMSFGLVVDESSNEREGDSDTFVVAPAVLRKFDAGDFVGIGWYREVALEVERAITGATSVAAGVDFDFFLDDRKFEQTGITLHRFCTLKGYALKPKKGYSVLAVWALLKKYRRIILRANREEQKRQWPILAKFYCDCLREAEAHFGYQMDSTSPAGERLEAFIAALSGTGGVISRLTTAITSHESLLAFKKATPGAIVADDYVAGSVQYTEWTQITGDAKVKGKQGTKRAGAGDDGDEDKSQGKGKTEIGSCRGRVTWLKHVDHADWCWYKIGSAKDSMVIGPLDKLAEFLNLGHDKRCWPVALSSKPDDLRCTMCPTPTLVGHSSKNKKMHAKVAMNAATRKEYTRTMSAYKTLYPRQPTTPSAPGALASI